MFDNNVTALLDTDKIIPAFLPNICNSLHNSILMFLIKTIKHIFKSKCNSYRRPTKNQYYLFINIKCIACTSIAHVDTELIN